MSTRTNVKYTLLSTVTSKHNLYLLNSEMKFAKKVAICALLLRNRKKRRKMWVYPLVSQRLLKGRFHKLFEELHIFPLKFFGYFRMSAASFEELLSIEAPYITYRNTNMRTAISPRERLAVTLR